jgi:hypothetical protein
MSEEDSVVQDWEEKVILRMGDIKFQWSKGAILLPTWGDSWVIWGEVFRDVKDETLRDLWVNVKEVCWVLAEVAENLEGDKARSFLRGLLVGDARVRWYKGAEEVCFDDGYHLHIRTLAEEQKAHLEEAFSKVEEITKNILSGGR